LGEWRGKVEEMVSANLTSWRGRRVLITGHTGFKGSWLSLWLTQLGAEVTGFSNDVPTEPSHFEALTLDMQDLRGNITDVEAVKRAIAISRPDIVFHLAAQSLVRRSYADPVGTYKTNLIGTLTLFEACREAGVSAIVSATTDKVYRNYERERRYSEEEELGGSDPYSASKSCVELMTRSYRESYLREGETLIASVRAGNVIGGGDWASDRLIPDIIRAAYTGNTLRIRNPNSTRPWQHVLDPLSGYIEVGARLLARDSTAADAWNFGPEQKANIQVQDILTLAHQILPDLKVKYEPTQDGLRESGLLGLNSSKAMEALGWRPRWEGQMLERTLEWYGTYYDERRVISAQQLEMYLATD
jgi:CDP-glucose 4,6-dehydratase